MVIESIMFFALGALIASLIALVITPMVWRRAVRLTKRRIEAATPMSMAEFRADKDQLRAEFALSTRKLEMTVETLRKRLAAQLGEANTNKIEAAALRAEHNQSATILLEVQTREAEVRAKVLGLDKDNADLAQRLRMRERELADKIIEIETLRRLGPPTMADAGNRTDEPTLETVVLNTLTTSEGPDEAEDLLSAEHSMALAQAQMNAILAEAGALNEPEQDVITSEPRQPKSLAETLSLEDQLDALRSKVSDMERAAITDWAADGLDETQMRERLHDIASSVSQLVYAVEAGTPSSLQETLFERVQRFANEDLEKPAKVAQLPRPRTPARRKRTGDKSAERAAAVREIQGAEGG